LIYASRSTEFFQEHEIPELLQQVRIANAKQEITGMLLYISGSFLQVLEGRPEMVDAVFSRILSDKRNTQIRSIARESIRERAFEGWTMMQKTLDPVEAGELIGEADYFTSPTWMADGAPFGKVSNARRPDLVTKHRLDSSVFRLAAVGSCRRPLAGFATILQR